MDVLQLKAQRDRRAVQLFQLGCRVLKITDDDECGDVFSRPCRGKRFANESTPYDNMLFATGRQPGGVFCQVFDGTHESYLLNFDITDEGIKNVVVTPLYLSDDYGIPDFATGDQALSQLEQIRDYSVDMNTSFEIRDGKAYLTPMS